VYLNGVKVYNFSSMTSFSDGDLYNKVIDVQLKEGENTLLVKTLQRYGDYSFTLNICEPESASAYAGNRVDGLYFYIAGNPGDTSSNPVSTFDYAASQTKFSVYPNPCHDVVYFQLENSNPPIAELVVYNLNGQLVKVIPVANIPESGKPLTWDLYDHSGCKLPAGQYIISSGDRSTSIKLLIR